MNSGYNLPPGCFESDLPGNSDFELEIARWRDALTIEDMKEYVANYLVGDLYFEAAEGGWEWEDRNGDFHLTDSEDDAILAVLEDREDEIEQQMVELEFGP